MILEGLQDKKTWNAIQTKFGHKATTEIHGGWIHYLDDNMDWQDIDCLFVKNLYGFDVTKAPFTFHAPLFSDEEAYFNVNNKFDVFKKETIDAPDFGQFITPLGVFRVEGQLFDINGDGRLDAVRYSDAYGAGIHLVYYVQHGRAPRLKKLVMFDVALPKDTTRHFSFQLRYTESPEISPEYKLDTTTRISARNTADTMFELKQSVYANKGFYVRRRNESQKRGIGIKTPLVWDSEGKQAEIQLYMDKGVDKNTYILTKVINADFFTDATLPVFTDTTSTFYPDSNPETTSFDGHTKRYATGESWATLIAGAGLQAVDSSTTMFMSLSRDGTGWNDIRKSIALFDTSSLGTDIVSSATLSVKPTSLGNSSAKDPNLNISDVTTVSNTGMSLADHLTHGSVQFSSGLAYSTLVISTYANFSLNALGLANIDTGGISKFGISDDYIITNTDPLFAASKFYQVAVSSADAAGTTNDPKLVVVHSALRTAGRGRSKNLHRKSTGMSVGLN